MQAQAFLKLVGEMLTAQQDYFMSRRSRQGDSHALLVTAKKLEKQVMEIVQNGTLEPDEKLMQLATFTREMVEVAGADDVEECLMRHGLVEQTWDEEGYTLTAVDWLDALTVQRPTDESKQESLFGE